MDNMVFKIVFLFLIKLFADDTNVFVFGKTLEPTVMKVITALASHHGSIINKLLANYLKIQHTSNPRITYLPIVTLVHKFMYHRDSLPPTFTDYFTLITLHNYTNGRKNDFHLQHHHISQGK